MPRRITIDSNVLVYALDSRDPGKQSQAAQLVEAVQFLPRLLIAITLGEVFWTVARKGFLSPALAKEYARKLEALFPILPYRAEHLFQAADAVIERRFSFWDGVMLTAAEEAGCTVCFSEDMKDGARLGELVVRNPFGRTGLSAAARQALRIQ